MMREEYTLPMSNTPEVVRWADFGNSAPVEWLAWLVVATLFGMISIPNEE